MMKAKSIALLQQKGGSGKTTTAMNLAFGLRELGYNVLVADMDKDKPDAWAWSAKNSDDANFVYQIDEKNARDQIVELKNHCEFLIIDTPPNFQTAALKAALWSDLVVIPAAPSGMDMSGLLEAKDLAVTAERPYRLLANRILKNTQMSKSLLVELEDEGNAFGVSIPQSVKFVEAEAQGLYIGEYAKGSWPHIQVKKLAKEVLSFFKKDGA
ncbi:ParA family protein [Thiotrichales bacterium 19S11-10]|nr:ParA family protein [Thiotrichales bacterium 19S11-10]MCF6807098.1 ParA family protein [Thiotrichales bacterium 19S9-11]MCF6811067.1 ParA family protein [Thiotrichales bacterium 19S9-12]